MLSGDSSDTLSVGLAEPDMLQPLQTPPPPPAAMMLHLLLSSGTSVDIFSPGSRVLLRQSLWLAARAVEGTEAEGEVGAEGWGQDWEGNQALRVGEREGWREGRE